MRGIGLGVKLWSVKLLDFAKGKPVKIPVLGSGVVLRGGAFWDLFVATQKNLKTVGSVRGRDLCSVQKGETEGCLGQQWSLRRPLSEL